MEKLFQESYRNGMIESLVEAGMPEIDAEGFVMSKYRELLRKVAVQRLEDVARMLREDSLDELEPLIRYSPSGGYGSESYYISFADVTDCSDINDVMFQLQV